MATSNEDSQRYEGKPFLRLLECYVLRSIDELPHEASETLDKMSPKLSVTYGKHGDWHEVVAQVMEFPPNMPTLIREISIKNREIAATNSSTLPPAEFARMFVDSNFPNSPSRTRLVPESMKSCPFKIGDEVIYRPTDRGRGLDIMTSLAALVPGKKYKVVQIEKDFYVVVEGFENTASGGLYWSEFAPVEEKTDTSAQE